MVDSPSTRPSLLIRIRDNGDRQAWEQFVETYAPLIYGFSRRQGLQDADAADLTQEVLRAVSHGVKSLEYDPDRGSFRAWLLTVVRNKLRDMFARRQSPGQGTGDTVTHELLNNQPVVDDGGVSEWDELYEQQLFARAAEQVRKKVEDSTWQAFWQTAVGGRQANEVAQELNMSVAAVYLAKGRVMSRLKERVRYMQDE
jgi:RNA polymerase sigma-70 factor (ECF subfamily)